MVISGQYVKIFSMGIVLAAVYIVWRLKALSEHSTSHFLSAMLVEKLAKRKIRTILEVTGMFKNERLIT